MLSRVHRLCKKRSRHSGQSARMTRALHSGCTSTFSSASNGQGQTRIAGRHRFPDGTRLHGDERVLRRAQRRGVVGDDPSRARSRRHVPRHGRRLRHRRQRGAGRQDDRAAPRRSVSRDEVREHAQEGRSVVLRAERTSRVRARQRATRRSNGSASIISICTISTASIRTRRSRRRSARWPSS